MLEKFERILYYTNEKATQKDWDRLKEWLIKNHFPCIDFPREYVALQSERNGGGYLNGEREYQFLSLSETMEYYEAYLFAKFMPFAFPFAMDGYGNFYIFNFTVKDEAIYYVHAGNLGWEQDQCFWLANCFQECLLQRYLLGELGR